MSVLSRMALSLIVVLASLGAAALGAFGSLDRLLADARYEATSRPASGQVVFVDIDSSSLAAVGVWPWPREVHAELLDRLLTAGAAEIALDIDFSTRSNPASDAALARALEAAGGFAYLAAFEQVDGATGTRRLSRPISEFAAHAEPVSVNVDSSASGVVESLTTATGGIPALSVVLAGMDPGGPSLHVDFGIDLATIDRIPAHEVLAGTVDPRRLADRQVVVGASAIELRDIFAVPRYGMIPGPLLQVAGVETLRLGRAINPWGQWPGAALALLLALGWALLGRNLRVRPALAAALGAIAIVEAVALLLQGQVAVTVATGGFAIAVLLLFGLHVALGFAVEFARRRRAEAQLVHLARHDPVTGLLSRPGLVERMEAQPAGALMLVAILRLELVRGTLGQAIAAATLRGIAERLGTLGLGTLALVDRDTFALVLPAAQNPDLEAIGREVRRALRPAFTVDGHDVHVDAALAAAPADTAPPQVQLQRAELALQTVLGQQGIGVTAFRPDMEDDVARRRRIDAALRQAIAKGELTVVYQPQARLADGVTVGVEALVRWTSPELGPVSPAEFIPLAEETGLIVPLGRFVLTEACRAAARWDWQGRLAVNVSAAQLRLTDIAETVADALLETGFDPARLDLEITESVMLDGPERLALTLEALAETGVGVALDDFGTGYSSLSYLSRLRFDKLKVDQSFVRRMAESPEEAAIVRTVVELAQRLGKTTVAEGIETEEQRALLQRMGCDIGQGWLIGRPVPEGEIAARIASERAA